MHDGALPSVRGNPELELAFFCMNGRNGEGDAVYTDAAFIYGVAQVFCRYADAYHVVLPHRGDGDNRTRGIHMPHDEMPAEAATGSHGSLQIADGARVERAQRGNAHGLGEQVELHLRAVDAVYREAAAVYGNGVTEEEAESMLDYLNEKLGEDTEVTIINGEQPLYYYVISVE